MGQQSRLLTYGIPYKPDSPVLIGKPISNTQIYIVNKKMELVPIGVSGEICIGGAVWPGDI